MDRPSRRIFRFTLLTSLLLGTMSVPTYASNSADPEIYFYPSNGWNIQQNAGSCSIASRFNNGFVLTFDGDERWIENMSIDFQQDVFESGKAYDVTLSVPGVREKTFKASGKSGSALHIGLRKQKDFYQALRQSSVLDMTLDDNNFRFYLTGFSQSAGNFERCMAGAVIENPEGKVAKNLTDRSEEKNFMVNESIAMEEKTKTKTQAIVEILPEDPKPVIQEIPVQETVKLGDAVIEERIIDGENSTILDTDVDDLLEKPAMQDAQEIGRKRLSEQLAEQIAKNPALIEVDESAPTLQARKSLEMPPGVEDLPLVPITEPETTAQENIEKAAAPVEDTPPAPEKLTPVIEEKAPKKIAKEDVVQPPSEALLEPVKEDVMEVAEIPPAEAVPPQPTVIKKSTPPMKVHKEVTKGSADFTHLEPAAPGPDMKEMRKQVLNLQDMVDALKKENLSLNDELKSALKESEDERLSISSENWNLERATMRFNEAERQIKRMGQQLQQERAKHDAEKRELEAMLFDPQVTDAAQLARLASLEEQLLEARKELEEQRARYEEQIRQRWEAGKNAE